MPAGPPPAMRHIGGVVAELKPTSTFDPAHSSHGAGTSKSRQIFRARKSLSSRWRGTDVLLRLALFTKTECALPSRRSSHPCA